MSPAWAICRDARRRAEVSQRELAARAGVSPSTVARIERGRVEPTLDLLLRLVHACGLELRMNLCTDDQPGTRRSNLVLDDRLVELHNLASFALEARRNMTG